MFFNRSTCILLFQKLPSPAPSPKSGNAPMLYRRKHSCDPSAHLKNSCIYIVLCKIFSKEKTSPTCITALLIDHEPIYVWIKSKELGELKISTRHVHTSRCGEYKVGVLWDGLAPFFDSFQCCFFAKLWYPKNHHVLACIKRWDVISSNL